MARPMTTEQKAATEAAKQLAETKARKQHMAEAEQYRPQDVPPVEPPQPPNS